MMRIAVVFSGRIDKYQEHYQNIISHVVQNHQADFFLSHSPEFVHEDLDDFRRLYQPKTVNNDPIILDDFSKYTCHPQSNSHNMMCMWYNRRRAYQDMCRYMEQTGTPPYDLVISTRLDTYNDEMLDYHLFECLDNNTILVPEGYDWGGLNDQMAIGRPQAMAKYLTLYDRIYEILDQLSPYYGPEPALKKNMEICSVEVYRFPFQYRLINGKLWHHA
jgi:hypothetical protein